jgi:hypothetical protein
MINKFKKVNIKSHTKLQEYIDFCISHNREQREDHHILPKDLFPEYKNLTENKWNKSTLSIIDHIKAHILLCEAIDEKSMYYARNMMLFTRDYRDVSEADLRKIEKIKLESRKKQSELMRERNPMKDNNIKEKALAGRKKYFESGGIGSMKNKKHSEEAKAKISEANKGKIIKEESKSNLNAFILRYGEIEGPKKYKENNIKKAVTLELYIAKHGKEEGQKIWDEINRKRSENLKGDKNPFFGKTHSDETRKHLSEKAKNRPKLTCPHCGKQSQPGMAKRWHFDNCKLKKDL